MKHLCLHYNVNSRTYYHLYFPSKLFHTAFYPRGWKNTAFYPCGSKDIETIQYQCSLQLIFLCTANSEMDKSSEKFTAEEVRKFLGLNDDYSNSSSSSSSDTNSEDKELCDNDWTISETDNEEEIIPLSPKRIRTIIRNENKNCQEYKLENGNYQIKQAYKRNATEQHSIPPQASGINQSSPTAQPTFKSVCQSENDIPLVTKHVELMTLQNTSITVPEPVFAIQLDIYVPEVRDSPDAEILENLHGVPNNEDEYPNLQLLVNINSQHLPVLLSHPEPTYLPQQDNHFQFNHPPDNEDDNDYYQIETHTTNSQNDDDFTPITNYLRDEIIDSDLQEGWEKIEPDIIPDHCPFTDSEGINMSTNSHEPEDFFNDIFEDRMFTIMAEETNNYARRKL